MVDVKSSLCCSFDSLCVFNFACYCPIFRSLKRDWILVDKVMMIAFHLSKFRHLTPFTDRNWHIFVTCTLHLQSIWVVWLVISIYMHSTLYNCSQHSSALPVSPSPIRWIIYEWQTLAIYIAPLLLHAITLIVFRLGTVFQRMSE